MTDLKAGDWVTLRRGAWSKVCRLHRVNIPTTDIWIAERGDGSGYGIYESEVIARWFNDVDGTVYGDDGHGIPPGMTWHDLAEYLVRLDAINVMASATRPDGLRVLVKKGGESVITCPDCGQEYDPHRRHFCPSKVMPNRGHRPGKQTLARERFPFAVEVIDACDHEKIERIKAEIEKEG